MSRKKNNKNSLSTFVNTILTIFGENPFKPMNYKQIAKIMSVHDAAGKDVIYQILLTLFKEGKLIEERPYRYLLHPDYIHEYGPKQQIIIGTVDMKSTGKAYVIPDDGGEDVFVAANNTGKSLHGDKVKVSIRFRGREMGYSKQGIEIMSKVSEALDEICPVEKPAKLEGRSMLMFLAPKTNKN